MLRALESVWSRFKAAILIDFKGNWRDLPSFTSQAQSGSPLWSVRGRSCVLVSVIEGDAMSPNFIPSQPEGVYLYPFPQAPWPALQAPARGGAGVLPHSPVFSFTWLQIQQIPRAWRGKLQATISLIRKWSPPRLRSVSKIYEQTLSHGTGLCPALGSRERNYAFPFLPFLTQPPLQ